MFQVQVTFHFYFLYKLLYYLQFEGMVSTVDYNTKIVQAILHIYQSGDTAYLSVRQIADNSEIQRIRYRNELNTEQEFNYKKRKTKCYNSSSNREVNSVVFHHSWQIGRSSPWLYDIMDLNLLSLFTFIYFLCNKASNLQKVWHGWHDFFQYFVF